MMKTDSYKSRRESVPLNRLFAALCRRRNSVPVLLGRLDAADRRRAIVRHALISLRYGPCFGG
jgi:hypothetical protein